MASPQTLYELLVAPPRVSALQQVPWRWHHVVVGLAPIVALRLVSTMIRSGWLPEPVQGLAIPLTLLLALWMLGYPLMVAWRHQSGPTRPGLFTIMIEAALVIPYWVLLFLTLLVIVLMATLLLGKFEPPANPLEHVSKTSGPVELITLAMMAVLLAPFAEELFFRGLLYNALRRRMPLLLAAILQAVIFGFLHAYNLTHSIMASLLGLALVLLYEWRRTLVAPILLHGFQNLIAALMTFALLASAAEAPRLGIRAAGEAEPGRVTEVIPGSGADDAGIRVGDVITAIDGQPVKSIDEVTTTIRSRQVGDVVTVELLREGETLRLEVELKRTGWFAR